MKKRDSKYLRVFDGTKFPVWKFYMELNFSKHKVMPVVNGFCIISNLLSLTTEFLEQLLTSSLISLSELSSNQKVLWLSLLAIVLPARDGDFGIRLLTVLWRALMLSSMKILAIPLPPSRNITKHLFPSHLLLVFWIIIQYLFLFLLQSYFLLLNQWENLSPQILFLKSRMIPLISLLSLHQFIYLLILLQISLNLQILLIPYRILILHLLLIFLPLNLLRNLHIPSFVLSTISTLPLHIQKLVLLHLLLLHTWLTLPKLFENQLPTNKQQCLHKPATGKLLGKKSTTL